MVLGSVPMAFLGAYLLHLLGNTKSAQNNIEIALGAALLIGAAAMVLRFVSRPSHRATSDGRRHDVTVRPSLTVAIGMIGGLIVGMTSVGSGSLMIVLLLFLYPLIGANQLVGTDLTQAVPLTHRRRPRRPGLRPRRVLGDRLDHHRQRAGGAGRVVHLLAGPRPLHPPGDHLRDLRLRPQVRRRGDDRPRLDPLRRSCWQLPSSGSSTSGLGRRAHRWTNRPRATIRSTT